MHDRAGEFVTAFVPEVLRHFGDKHQRVLLVSHAATVIALARMLVGNREMPFRAGCCTITTMRKKQGAEKEVGGWEVIVLGTGDHLKEGVQRDWGFEDIELDKGEVVRDSGIPGTQDEADYPCGLHLPESAGAARM